MKVNLNSGEQTLKIFFNFLLLITAVITFLPLLKIGFVTSDDFEYFLHSGIERWKLDRLVYAQHTGRFYFLLVKWIYFIPYLVPNVWYYHAMRIIPIIAGIVLFFWLLKRFDYDKPMILIGILLFLASFQLYGAASAVTAYPFYFSFAIVLILCSLHLIISYYNTGKYYFLIISSIIMAFVSLFQESMLMYYILIFLIIIFHYNIKTLFKKENILKFIKEIAPFVFFGLVYVIVYIVYANLHPSNYIGNQVSSDVSLAKTTQIFLSLISSSAPLSSFFNYRFSLITHSEALSTEYSFWYYLKEAGTIAYLKSFIIILLYFVSIKLFADKFNLNKKQILNLLIFGIIVTILPQIPMLLAGKTYIVLRLVYVTAYFSFFGIIMIMMALVYYLNIICRKRKILFIIINCCIGIIIFLISLLTQYSNEMIAKDINISQDRTLILKEFSECANLKDKDIVYTLNLYYSKTNFGKDITSQPGSNFGELLNKVYDIRIVNYRDYNSLYNKYHKSNDTINIFFYAQAAKSHDTYIALVKCIGKQLTPQIRDLSCDNIKFGYRSPYKKFSMSIATQESSALRANKIKTSSYGNMHIFNIAYYGKQPLTEFEIAGKNIYPASLSVSNIIHPHANTIKIDRYGPKLEKKFAKHFKRMILNDKAWTEVIEEKAKERDKTFEEVLDGDAIWLIYN